jgi:hypothetical protein
MERHAAQAPALRERDHNFSHFSSLPTLVTSPFPISSNPSESYQMAICMNKYNFYLINYTESDMLLFSAILDI